MTEWKQLLYTSLLALYVVNVLHILSWILFYGISDVVLQYCPRPSSKKGKTGKTLNHSLPSEAAGFISCQPADWSGQTKTG